MTTVWGGYLKALALMGGCTLVVHLMLPHFAPVNLVMVYLAGVVIVAYSGGAGPAIAATLLSVAAFDFFFVEPRGTFAVADTEYLLTLAIMLAVAILVSTLTVRVRQAAEQAREREARTARLYALSRDLTTRRDIPDLVGIAARHLAAVFASRVVFLLPDPDGELRPLEGGGVFFSEHEQGVADWVYRHHQPAGLNTDTLPASRGLYLPLISPDGIAGVLAVYPDNPTRFQAADQLQLAATFANHTALALASARLAAEAERARIAVETERARNLLLSSVSHDLRTPLAVITGATSSLVAPDQSLTDADRRDLAQVAYEEAARLNRFVGLLLDMTRLEAGGVRVNKDWQLLEEVVGAALARVNILAETRPIRVRIPPDFPLVPFDAALIEQVLVNLLENALKYSPDGTPIDVSASLGENEALVEVANRGPGFAPGDAARVFDKFYRARPAASAGVGLGLSICKGIIELHGGRIEADNRPGGGAVFRFSLPFDSPPPEIDLQDDPEHSGRADPAD